MIIAVLALLLQTERDIEAQVKRLVSEDKQIRQTAYQALRGHMTEAIPVLRRHTKEARAYKVRKRLAETLRYFLSVQGAEHFKKGDLDRSMTYYAEAAGASDTQEYVRKRLTRTRAEIRARFPRHIVIESYSGMAHDLKGTYGPWGVKVLIEELSLTRFESNMGPADVIHLLALMGNEALPSLEAALTSDDWKQKRGACSVLHEMWWKHKRFEATDGMLEALRKLRDETPDRDTRREAARLVRWVEAKREQEK